MNRPEYQSVGKSVRKKDAMQQLLGKPLYTEDIVRDALVVKLLRSPHANAIVEAIDTSKAKKVAGVVDVFTWEDVPERALFERGPNLPRNEPLRPPHHRSPRSLRRRRGGNRRCRK